MQTGKLEFEMLPAMSLVSTSPKARLVALLLAVGFLCLLVGLVFVPWQQNISGEGRVVALTPVERQQTIDAPIEGRLLRWHVTEGTLVKTGDVVAEITDNDPSILDRYQKELAAGQERLGATRLREQSL